MIALRRGHLKAGLDSVRSAKLRSFWTMLGIIIGVASVITVVGIGEGIKSQISGQIHHLGKDLITVRPTQLQVGSAGSSSINLLPGVAVNSFLTTRDLATIQQVKGVAASAPLTILTGSSQGDHNYDGGFVIGTTPDLSGLLNQSLAYGSFLTASNNGSDVAVLGQNAAAALFNEDVPLGRSFTFDNQQFIVQGIFNEFNTTPLSQDADFNNAIFIPDDVAEGLAKNAAPIYEILARPTLSSQTAAVASSIRHALSAAHGGQNDFSVLEGNQNLTVSNNIVELLTHLIAGVAAISLLVGGIGIMNVMLVSVTERMHEIGIRKAVGATNRQILSQFMIEASVLSLSGGLIGIVLALATDLVLRLTTNLQPLISWQIIVLSTAVSLVVGIIFGSFPALKAARKHPIEALRSE
jgi:putative ABC transport system permease protein